MQGILVVLFKTVDALVEAIGVELCFFKRRTIPVDLPLQLLLLSPLVAKLVVRLIQLRVATLDDGIQLQILLLVHIDLDVKFPHFLHKAVAFSLELLSLLLQPKVTVGDHLFLDVELFLLTHHCRLQINHFLLVLMAYLLILQGKLPHLLRNGLDLLRNLRAELARHTLDLGRHPNLVVLDL